MPQHKMKTKGRRKKKSRAPQHKKENLPFFMSEFDKELYHRKSEFQKQEMSFSLPHPDFRTPSDFLK